MIINNNNHKTEVTYDCLSSSSLELPSTLAVSVTATAAPIAEEGLSLPTAESDQSTNDSAKGVASLQRSSREKSKFEYTSR